MSKNNKNRKKRILKKSIKPFPCTECLLLARCKALKETCETEYEFIQKVQEQCDILQDYINQPHFHNRTYSERKLYMAHSKIRHRVEILKQFFRTIHNDYPWKDI